LLEKRFGLLEAIENGIEVGVDELRHASNQAHVRILFGSKRPCRVGRSLRKEPRRA
jgi:hypothetical protein